MIAPDSPKFLPHARLAVLFLAIFALSGCASCEPQPNLGLYKQKLTAWHDTGEHARCFAKSARVASGMLRGEIAKRPSGRRLAVVLDIDVTCLSN